MSNIRVYVICYNEENILPFFVKSYRNRFPDCAITVYDNCSTDRTKELAIKLGCDIINFSTKNQMADSKHRDIKNNCWKGQKEEWAVCVDADEIITATVKDLNENFNVWNFYGVQMVGQGEPIEEIKFGVRDDLYSKAVLFNTFSIAEMNYSAGSHSCQPIAKESFKVCYNDKIEALLHYKWLDLESVLEKHRHYAVRQSNENKTNRWSVHYAENEFLQRNYYDKLLKQKLQVLG